MSKQEEAMHKPLAETILNTCAIALTGFGVTTLTTVGIEWERFIRGIILVFFGAGLEFFKYWGRKNKYWC